MTVNSLQEFVDKVNKDLGDFCSEFAYKRKELAMLGKAPLKSVLFKYSNDGRDWCINEGGHTEIQFHLYLRGNELGYGLGFNTQYTPFANEKSPEEYMRPFAEAYLKLKPSHWTKWTSTGLSWIEGNGDTLFKNLERDNYVLFGRIIRISDNQIDNSSYNILLQDIKGVMFDMYKDIFEEVKHNKKREMESIRIFDNYKKILVSNYNLILTGAPGTGKTYLAKEIAESFGAKGESYGFVQFHPSFDYSDFIEGLRPIKKAANSSKIGFERKDGIFMAFCRKALKAYQNSENKADAPKYVFVIDEINRGEMSKIFGELFFSVDPGYRGAEGRISTQYSNLWTKEDIYDDTLEGDDKHKFYIPENVYIIGTMNDIDRSVESMDFAMRRRFAFKEVKADSRVEMINESNALKSYFEEICARMYNLNLCILTIQGLSSAYQIGASYFLKLKNYLEDDKLTDNSWENLWENHIYGLLFEYLRGVPDIDKQLHTLQKAYNLVEKYEEKDGVVKKVITEAND